MDCVAVESIELFLIRARASLYDEGEYINVLMKRMFVSEDTLMMPLPIFDAGFFLTQPQKFMLSHKLTGTRCMVISDETKTYYVLRDGTKYVSALFHMSFKNLVLDCEIVGQNIWVLDVIVYNGMRARHFALRYSYMRRMSKDEGRGLYIQNYYPYALFVEKFDNIDEGVIFNRIDGEYNSFKPSSYKFKTYEHLTVDLIVRDACVYTADDKYMGYVNAHDGIYEFDNKGKIIMKRLKRRADKYQSVVNSFKSMLSYSDIKKWTFPESIRDFDIDNYISNIKENEEKEENKFSSLGLTVINDNVVVVYGSAKKDRVDVVNYKGKYKNDNDNCNNRRWKPNNMDDFIASFSPLVIEEWGLDVDCVDQFAGDGTNYKRERNSVFHYSNNSNNRLEVKNDGTLSIGSKNFKYKRKQSFSSSD